MSEIPELKPCPFCGSKAHMSLSVNGYPGYWACCCDDECGAEVLGVTSREGSARLWNRRALSPSPSTEQEPVAWRYEYKSLAYGGNWQTGVNIHIRPEEGKSIRNVEPLYASPALSSSHPPKESEWQPIATAPRDGSYVWLWNKHVSHPWDAPQKFRWSKHYSVFGLGGCWTDGLCTMGDGIDFDFWCSLLPAAHSNPYETLPAAATNGGQDV